MRYSLNKATLTAIFTMVALCKEIRSVNEKVIGPRCRMSTVAVLKLSKILYSIFILFKSKYVKVRILHRWFKVLVDYLCSQ